MIEKLFELIAPDECVLCQREGLCICKICQHEVVTVKKPACVLCNTLCSDGRVCKRCKPKTKLAGSSISYRYKGVVKELVHGMKYANRRSVARFFACKLPKVDISDVVVSFVPCDGPARRARGYDQAELIARKYAKLHNYQFRKLLVRVKHTKQVGQKRHERFRNVKNNFHTRATNLDGLKVILVDDVITTGATVSECASTLRQAGAKTVWALAVAKK